MAEGLGRGPGGIRGLVQLIEEHGESVEYDLIRHGLRLAQLETGELSWRDLWVIVRHMPPHESALWRVMNPDDAPWNMDTFLQAEMVDTLRLLVWQKTKDGQKGRGRPKPIPRPGHRPKKFGGGGGMSLAEADAWLSRSLSE